MALIITPIYGKARASGEWEVEPMNGAPYFHSLALVKSEAPRVFVRLRPREHLEAILCSRPGVAPFAREALSSGGCHIGIKYEPRRGAGGVYFEQETHGVDLKIEESTPLSWIDAATLLNPDTWGWLCEETDAAGDARVPDTTDLANQIARRSGKLPAPRGK